MVGRSLFDANNLVKVIRCHALYLSDSAFVFWSIQGVDANSWVACKRPTSFGQSPT